MWSAGMSAPSTQTAHPTRRASTTSAGTPVLECVERTQLVPQPTTLQSAGVTQASSATPSLPATPSPPTHQELK